MENTSNSGEKIAQSPIFKNILAKAEEYIKKPLRIKQLLNDAYQKASEKKDVGTIAHEVWESLQTLSRMIKTAVSGEYTGIPTRVVVGGVAVLLYFLSPIDFVPDFIPVIGLLDDAALLAWFMTSIKAEMDKFEDWEKGNQADTIATAMMGGNQSVDNSANTPKYSSAADATSAIKTNASTANSNRSDDTYQESQYRTSGGGQDVGQSSPQQRNEDGSLKNDEEKLRVKDFTAHDLPTESNTPDDAAIKATSSGTGEPNVRAATTDSTRLPNSNNDDRKAGGNIR